MPMRLHLTELQTYALRAALRTHAADARTALHFANLRANTTEAAEERKHKAQQYRELADIAMRLGTEFTATQFRQMVTDLEAMEESAKRTARQEEPPNRYDYQRQAWIVDGRYATCGHPDSMACDCYGRLHAGELAPPAALVCAACGAPATGKASEGGSYACNAHRPAPTSPADWTEYNRLTIK
jgi:hypothetical protein